MKRPAGTRKRYDQRLTAAERKKIIALTRAGDLKQIEIANAFRCGTDTIRRIQQTAGLKLWRELTPAVEREVVALLRLGRGQYRVSRMTKVPQPKVHEVMLKHNIFHPFGEPSSPAKRARVLAKIRARTNYCVRIAKEEGVSKEYVRKLAHQIWGPGRFLPAPIWPPMSSIFPQTNVDFTKMTEPDQFVAVVQCVLEKSFDGKFPFAPEHDRLFIAAMLVGLQRINPDFDGQSQAVLDSFAAGLTQAVSALRQSENSTWKN